MLSASSFRHLRYVRLQIACALEREREVKYNVATQQNPAGQKMHVIECGVCRWQTVLYTWLNLNRRLNFVLCSGKICVSRLLWRAHMIGAGKRIILGHFRHTLDTIDRRAGVSLPDFNVLISPRWGPELWGSKTSRTRENIQFLTTNG